MLLALATSSKLSEESQEEEKELAAYKSPASPSNATSGYPSVKTTGKAKSYPFISGYRLK